MKSQYSLFVCFLFLFLFISCNRIEPDSPDIKIDTTNFKKPSIISIPFEINLKPAFDLAETSIPPYISAGRYNEQFGTGGADACPHGVSCGYQVNRSPLKFSMNKNVLTTSLSFSYWIDCRTHAICNTGPLISLGCDDRLAHGSLSTQINMDNNWNSLISTKNNGIIADNDCKVGVFGIINVTDKIMAGFNSAFNKAAQTLDNKIKENLNSRERISEAWEKISKPIEIKNLGWLAISPDSIKLSEFTLEDNKAKINFFLRQILKFILDESQL